jgi:hypothetical protein
MSIRSLTLAILMASSLDGLPAALAQMLPVGPEFQVNSYTTSFSAYPAVAADGVGNFVVAWTSFGSSGPDTDGFSVQAQRYDNAGAPLGDQFQVNTYTTNFQVSPVVAVDGAGNFVVVWKSYGSAAPDTSNNSIQGQRFDSTGTPQGGEFQVNTYTTGIQEFPVVAADSTGNFVVVWASAGGSGSDTDASSIQGQRYNAAGVPMGGEFQVNTYTTGFQVYPAVAADSAGNFVVVWETLYTPTIQGQRFDSGGTPQGGEFQVNSYTTNMTPKDPAVATDGAGNFVVTWSGPATAYSQDFVGIQGRRYDSAGAPQGSEFLIAPPTLPFHPALTADAAGNVLVVWTDGLSSSRDVLGRRYDATGTSQGDAFQVNTYTTGDQDSAAVASLGLGNFVVVWHRIGSWSIQAQRFVIPLTTTTSTTSTSTTLFVSLPGRSATIKPGTLAKFVAKPFAPFTFALGAANPIAEGGSLRIFDTGSTAGDDSYTLPLGANWKGLGSPAGSKGYKYRGAGTLSDPCKLVLVKETVIKAVCRGTGITLDPPFTGDVGIILSLGTTERYCARFGGDESRNDATLTRRKNAPAPGACP